MILKGQPISFDRHTQPMYVIKFNIVMVCFFIGWLILCTPTLITVGCIYGERPEFYITFGVLFGLFLVGVLILYIVALKLRERIVSERTAEIEEKFADMPLDEATRILKERGVITDDGFVSERGDLFGGKVVPFDRAEILVLGNGQEIYADGQNFKVRTHPLYIETFVHLFDGVEVREPCATYDLDGALFNFIDKRDLIKNLEENGDFIFLKLDKRNFCRRALGFKLK